MFARSLSVVFPALVALALGFATPAAAAELIVANSDSAVQVKGKWATTNTTPGFFGNDYMFRVAGDGKASVTWPFPASTAAGRYEVFAQWSAGPNRATNATYQITSN